LFPILAFAFIIGWLLYSVGEPKTGIKKSPQRRAETAKENALEMGLIAEAEEEQLVAN